MIALPKPQKFQARLANITKISSKVYLERFELIEPKEITFMAGQTVMLYVAPGINRSMSIASVPGEKHVLDFVHDVSPMGPYSKWALAAKPEDPMSFMGPLGLFVVDKESPRKKIFVATGSGIAPFYAMAKDYLTHGGTSDVALYWGLRHEEDIFWQKEFEELSKLYPDFHYVLTLSQPADSWSGKRGHVQEHIFSGQQIFSDADYYLCGSKAMVDDMRVRLKTAGVPETQVKFELFY
jgi:CDP-4-dehydro-6-deoxyglucose reductase